MQQFLTVISQGAPDIKSLKDGARDEQPFLPELAWAYYHAYRSTITSAYVRFHVFKSGIEDPDKFLTFDGLRDILKAVLPHQSQWIATNEPEAFYGLLDQLERLLPN